MGNQNGKIFEIIWVITGSLLSLFHSKMPVMFLLIMLICLESVKTFTTYVVWPLPENGVIIRGGALIISNALPQPGNRCHNYC